MCGVPRSARAGHMAGAPRTSTGWRQSGGWGVGVICKVRGSPCLDIALVSFPGQLASPDVSRLRQQMLPDGDMWGP